MLLRLYLATQEGELRPRPRLRQQVRQEVRKEPSQPAMWWYAHQPCGAAGISRLLACDASHDEPHDQSDPRLPGPISHAPFPGGRLLVECVGFEPRQVSHGELA